MPVYVLKGNTLEVELYTFLAGLSGSVERTTNEFFSLLTLETQIHTGVARRLGEGHIGSNNPGNGTIPKSLHI